MNKDLFMFTGMVAVAVPAAEAGSAAVMESKPAAKVTEDGNVTTTTNETPQASAPADTGSTKSTGMDGSMTGSATGTTSSAAPETTGTASGDAESGRTGSDTGTAAGSAVNETTGDDAGMNAGETGGMAGDTGAGNGMNGMDGMNTEIGTSKSVTQNAPAMIGITAGVLALSILVGIGLAKLKIKKGINLYED